MKLILNADDFGLSPSVNKGIVEAFQQGIISSATIRYWWTRYEIH